jgi:hypothetical protein
VEFDGRQHFTDPEQLVRDERKNAICCKALFPILRIDAEALRRVQSTPVVEWLADLWFVYHDLWLPARAGWEEAAGYDPDDWDDDLYAAVRRHEDFSYTDFMTSGKPDGGVPEFAGFAPFDPFHEARHEVTLRGFAHEFARDALPSWYTWFAPAEAFRETDPQGREVGHVVVPVGVAGVVIGKARCWNPGCMFTGDPNLGTRVAVDLAMQQAADFLGLYDRGQCDPMSWDEAGRHLGTLKSEAERRGATFERDFVRTAQLDQHDHRQLSYRRLRRWGMDENAARRAAYSLRWDEDGRLIDDDLDRELDRELERELDRARDPDFDDF